MSSVIKMIFISFNSAIIIMGGVLFTLSLLFIVDQGIARNVLTETIKEEELVEQVMHIGKSISGATLTIGLVLCLISGLGCWGALTQHISMLNVYMGLVSVITVVTFCFLIFFAVNKSKVMTRVYDHMVNKLVAGYDGDYEEPNLITLTIDALQIFFDCCGIYDHTEYDQASMWENRTVNEVSDLRYPFSCCAWNKSRPKSLTAFDEESFHDADTCLAHSGNKTHDAAKVPDASNYLTPCQQKLDKYTSNKMGIVFAIGSVSFIVQFASLFMAYVFKRNAQQDD